MKNKIIKIIAITILLAMLIALAVKAINAYNYKYFNREYGAVMVVLEIERGNKIKGTTDVLTLIDSSGNVWEYEHNGYNVNDVVAVILENNATTDTITDDIIVGIWRCGTVDTWQF